MFANMVPSADRGANAMVKGPRVSDAAIKALAQYWFRAHLMREHTHRMRKRYLDNATKRRDTAFKKRFWEFDAYLSHWLSALFVVVEGFNKLKMRDARVQKLFQENVSRLKQVRHQTYHFSEQNQSFLTMIGELNWAEELHEAIGEVIGEVINRRTQVELFLKYRTTAKKKIAR
jgi:hypothetical protein